MKAFISAVILIGLPTVGALAAPDIEVLKSVNNAFPAANEPVEFTVQITNIGDQAAADVLILDRLPSEMQIPDGTAVFASVGNYDPASGEWMIGNMNPGDAATLVIPAVITDPQPPDCITNTALSQFPDALGDNNDEARVALYQDGVERCVDVAAYPDIRAGSSSFPVCDSEGRYNGTFNVWNNGPDAARDVTLTFTQSPVVGAIIRFDDARCIQTGSNVCTLLEVAAGERIELSITSDLFRNATGTNQQINATIVTSDFDYSTGFDDFDTEIYVSGFSDCAPGGFGDFGTIGPSGCFIATAAYGSPLDSRLDTLRTFRDQYLMTNTPGRSFVAFYYRYSPPLADFISDRKWLRAIVRGVIAPIVYSIEHPARALLILIGLISVVVFRRRIRVSMVASGSESKSQG